MTGKTIILSFVSALIVYVGSMGVLAQAQPELRPAAREYVIGINDTLNIQVWRSQEFTRRVVVRSDGNITMPLLGDIKAANLTKSTFEANLKKQLQKYLKQPQITVDVSSSKEIRIRFSGVISQEAIPPRGTTLLQVLRGILANLQQIQPPPNLAEMKVIGADNVFPVNGIALLSGKAPEANIRLEWGDEIYIPSGVLPTPIPTETPPPITRKATLSAQQFEDLVQQFPEAEELLRSLATQPDEDTYSIDMTGLSEDQREQLGEEVLAELEKYTREVQIPSFTDITLAGININLTLEETVEAFLAIPNPNPEELPIIQRFRESELVEKAETETEDIYLDEIQDANSLVLLRKGDAQQALPLLNPFSSAKLSGILDLGNTRKVFFSDLISPATSKRPTKHSFEKGDEVEEGVFLAEISDQWVLLTKGEEIQLVLLRDPRNRSLPTPTPAPLPAQHVQILGTDVGQKGQTLPETIKKTLPESLQMLDPAMLDQLQTQGKDLLLSPEDIQRLLIYNGHLAMISQTLDDQSVSLTKVMQPLFRLARERTSSDGDAGAENRAVLLTLAMYVNERNVGDLMGIGGVSPRPRQVQVTLLDRPDLAQHFLVSAAITAIADSNVANMVGLSKEVDDSKGGSGFNFADLAADRAGVRFAELATGAPRQAQLLQQQMSEVVREADFMPQVDNLPEGLMEPEFQQRYQDQDSVAYRMVNEEIERRIAACQIYQ